MQGDVNIVDDDEMSSQGSVHSPFVVSSAGTPLPSLVTQQTTEPVGSPLRPQSPVPHAALTIQSNIGPQASAFATMGPVTATSGSGTLSQVAPIVPVKVPTLEETKAAFGEVSSAF